MLKQTRKVFNLRNEEGTQGIVTLDIRGFFRDEVDLEKAIAQIKEMLNDLLE